MTYRISVISNSRNGKKDRMKLAATEKAKGRTSARSRYSAVERRIPSAGAARCSAAPFLSESSMGVIDDTGFSILSNTYGFPSRRFGLGPGVLGGGFGQGSHSFPPVLSHVSACLSNLSAIWLLPIGIFLLLSGASSIG